MRGIAGDDAVFLLGAKLLGIRMKGDRYARKEREAYAGLVVNKGFPPLAIGNGLPVLGDTFFDPVVFVGGDEISEVGEPEPNGEGQNEGEENFGEEGHREDVRVPPQDSISWGGVLFVLSGSHGTIEA